MVPTKPKGTVAKAEGALMQEGCSVITNVQMDWSLFREICFKRIWSIDSAPGVVQGHTGAHRLTDIVVCFA